jgi:hypothetical protein
VDRGWQERRVRAVKDMKLWEGRRVRLLRRYQSKSGTVLERGDVVTLHRQGVVRVRLKADDGSQITVGVEFQRHCFEPLE